ncbi:phage head-tail connector protein [Rhizobium sp. LjRoot30]|uniref:phage head-tail connector protein n=1 Tax=Rhizobium sp. LjRoot30 TaxID=3342320 RepID=UPI003ECC705C
MLTVITPATVFNLVDLSAVRSALGIVDQSDDEALQGFLDRASDVIARHCRRVFALETVQEQFRPDGWREELILSRYPVVDIVSITEKGNVVAVPDYEIDKPKGMLLRLNGDRQCWWAAHKIVVTYSAGYNLPQDTPPALQQACIQLVKSYYMSADRDPMLRSESVSDVSSSSYFANRDDMHMPPDVLSLLKQFRKFK